MKPDRFARLKALFIEANNLPQEQRRAYLDRACNDDPDLRDRVAALLECDDGLHELLKTGAVLPGGALGEDEDISSTLAPSTIPHQFADYRIIRKLGEGGMGTVYLAEDIRLRRPVALKFLRTDSVPGEEATTRFVHEAQAAAALDHPNVCTIHEINRWEGHTFISMAYVEGVTLRDHMASGPLSIEETVGIGLQIALGLDQAHKKDIVHRDLKPSNIMLSSSGPVKIMDFGLARSGDRSNITRTGTRLGTIGYMSPEQVRGDNVGHRSDIWALGVVLYETLAGQLPFRGDADHAIGYNIVHEKERRLREVRDDVPSTLHALIDRCLKKNPADRLDAADVVRVLDALHRKSGEAEAVRLLRRRRGSQALVAAGLALVLILAIAGLWQSWIRGSQQTGPKEPRLRRLTVLPPDVSNRLLPGSISPDGRYFALPLRHIRGDWAALGVISVEAGRTRHIPGPEGDIYSVGWMPDGETLLSNEYRGDLPWRQRRYSDASRSQIWLRNIVLDTSRKIYEHPSYTTILWPSASPDGESIAMFRGNREAIWIMDPSGENLRKIRETPGDWLGNPIWSPTATRVAYVRQLGAADFELSNLETCDLEGNVTTILEGETDLDSGQENGTLVWLPDGRLIYSRWTTGLDRSNQLWSILVDPDSGLKREEPARFLRLDGAAIRQPTVSADGRRMAFYKQQLRVQPRLLELSATGDSVGVGRWTSQDWRARAGAWTRDGRKLFFTVEISAGNSDIYIADVEKSLEEPVINTPDQDRFQCLTPDGSALIYWQGNLLKRMPVDGGPAVVLFRSPTPVDKSSDISEKVMCGDQPGARCVLKRVDGDETVFFEFDHRDGSVREELARIDLRVARFFGHCDLSPDGSRIAIVDIAKGRLLVLDLADGSIRELEKNWRGRPESVSWSGDSTWLCVTGRQGVATNWMRRVGLDGSSKLIWRNEERPVQDEARPSPDGSRVAFRCVFMELDVWVVEDF